MSRSSVKRVLLSHTPICPARLYAISCWIAEMVMSEQATAMQQLGRASFQCSSSGLDQRSFVALVSMSRFVSFGRRPRRDHERSHIMQSRPAYNHVQKGRCFPCDARATRSITSPLHAPIASARFGSPARNHRQRRFHSTRSVIENRPSGGTADRTDPRASTGFLTGTMAFPGCFTGARHKHSCNS